jgi:hypothetical protein
MTKLEYLCSLLLLLLFINQPAANGQSPASPPDLDIRCDQCPGSLLSVSDADLSVQVDRKDVGKLSDANVVNVGLGEHPIVATTSGGTAKLWLAVLGGLAGVILAGVLLSSFADRLIGSRVRPRTADGRILIRWSKVWKWFSTNEGSRIETWWGGDTVSLVAGAPFFAVGLTMFVLLFRRSSWGQPNSWTEVVLTLLLISAIGCGLTALGAAALFYRQGAVLDKVTGTATVWWNLLWWHRRKTLLLHECRSIELRYVSSVKSPFFGKPRAQYSLLLKTDTSEFPLFTGPQQAVTRMSVVCAQFLGLSLESDV